MKRFTPRIRWIAGVLAVVVLLGAVGWYKLLREEPLPYLSDVDYFKYGSVGVEAASGLPYAVWAVLPEVFGDLVGGPAGGPRGYAQTYEKSQGTEASGTLTAPFSAFTAGTGKTPGARRLRSH